MKRFFRRADVHLILFVVTGNVAINLSNRLAEIYRDGVPTSLTVAAVHVLAVVAWGLFMWQFERLEKQLRILREVAVAFQCHKQRRESKAREVPDQA